MKSLELFTQHAYLTTAAVRDDSKIIESPEMAYLITPSCSERWMNSVVRCTYKYESFNEIRQVTNVFDHEGINFNWHLWPSSNSKLAAFLENSLGMLSLGTGKFFTKLISKNSGSPHEDSVVAPLAEKYFDRYIDAKMCGWGNSSNQRHEIEAAARRLMKDPRNSTFLLLMNEVVVAAVSSFAQDGCAYLRGDFVVPEYRGKGFYKKLIKFRELELARTGIRWLTTIADVGSSAPIYQKMDYSDQGDISFFARKKSLWVSL